MQNNFKLFFFIFLLISILYSFSINAQTSVKCINPNQIPQKHKYKFIHNKYLEKVSNLDDLNPECYNVDDSDSYYSEIDSFIVKKDINIVWQKYKTISLKDTYSGHIVKLGFVYSKKKRKIYYINDKYDGIKVGQIYFIRLNLLGGIKKLIVAYEVTKIDDKKKMIQFCYINNGISQGSQRIFLYKTKEGFTKILHKTYYKSRSKLRDRRLYPIFHKRVVEELHHNLIKSLSLN